MPTRQHHHEQHEQRHRAATGEAQRLHHRERVASLVRAVLEAQHQERVVDASDRALRGFAEGKAHVGRVEPNAGQVTRDRAVGGDEDERGGVSKLLRLVVPAVTEAGGVGEGEDVLLRAGKSNAFTSRYTVRRLISKRSAMSWALTRRRPCN